MKALDGNWNLTTGPMLHAVLAAYCSTDRSRIMPALAVAGVRWHIASDDVPLFATFGSAFHAIWILVILLTSQSILNMPNQCHHEGRQYIATVTGLLLCFTLGFMVEILLIWEGCKGKPWHAQVSGNGCLIKDCTQSLGILKMCLASKGNNASPNLKYVPPSVFSRAAGAPFELSKRKRMSLFLFFRLANLALETLITAYGTYVVFGTHVSCKVAEEVIWDPKKEVKVLVCLTWGFQVIVL